jgi:phage shock protein PspC (stress-responsive transcriptional regulator)
VDKTILVGLGGRPDRFRLDPDAYDRLERYLDRSSARLQGDPDRAEVMGDLERSLGDKLAAITGGADRVVTAAEIDGVLEEIGAVDTGRDPAPEAPGQPPRKRRLRRIHEGKVVAGVCTGLADYAEIDLDWVRWGVVLGSIFTGGILGVVYVALIFILPVTPTREA